MFLLVEALLLLSTEKIRYAPPSFCSTPSIPPNMIFFLVYSDGTLLFHVFILYLFATTNCFNHFWEILGVVSIS